MPNQNQSTGVRQPQVTDQQDKKQSQRLPSMKATVNWLNPNDDDSIRATASLTIGGAFAVHGIKVTSGSKGDFVSMPSYKSKDGYKDIFHAVTADAREQMNNTVMAAYEQKLAEQQGQNESPAQEAQQEPVQEEKGQAMAM